MAKVGILVPRENMKKDAETLLKEIQLDVICCRTIVTADVVNEARAAVEAGAQILIARGYQAQILRKFTDIPLVEIRFTGQEVGLLLRRAKEISGRPHPHVAIIAFENMLPDTSHMASLMDLRLTVTTISDAEVVGGLLDEYEKDRPDVIIGGEITCAAALERGYLTLFYQSTKESIAEALKAAQSVSYAIDTEQMHTARFDAVLDTSFNGIIQVNAERCVLSLNYEVEQLLGKKEADVLGMPVDELLPQVDLTSLTRVLSGERENITISAELNKEAFMLLISPIELSERIIGAILSLRQISAMSSLSRQAKRNLLLSGYRTTLTFRDLKTRNARMQKLLEDAKIFSLSDSPILFYEAEGNEAAMIARAIHNNSDRKSGPFVSMDIRDLAPGEQISALLDRGSAHQGLSADPRQDSRDSSSLNRNSPLYSSGRSASEPAGRSSSSADERSSSGRDISFAGTGFPGQTPGALIRANEGTLFINRIEKLTLQAQHQLLRLLLPWSYMHTDARPIDNLSVRIIACAKSSLLPAVEADTFSEALYYHFSGMTLTIPALETRPEDLKDVFQSSLEKYSSRYHRHMQLTEEGLRLIPKLRWPGGFSQIDTFCERVILTSQKRRIDEQILRTAYNALYPEVRRVQGEQRLVVYDTPQAQQIRGLLEKHGGDRAAVARELGVSKTTLWRYMKKYNVTANYTD